ncbi:MAG: hypothetical protein UT30_C0001G0051 [Candidatus Uhrbacteria bacterium GW2011_GWF2_39_13]|uniref:Uncharacterized protein n=1 Tax=Candidatus Uhrbacteria bacterium GW2011_GWF2_39_13 TaxID=1618995 RepID=A0A0G0QU16_9BACT|nr:MAG: hypothetical protein UT30_C0001G0051 [Candidatus Uhrbacteria bacterium GW2011_GWF2_39_13]HAU66377.1 hypothetical protein [Candidatus Uhrbacteria bacterium]
MSEEAFDVKVLREIAGLMKDLFSKLEGESTIEWVVAFKRFLQKENPWDPVSKDWFWRKIDENTIEVNLDFPIGISILEAKLQVWKKCSGLVTVMRKGKDLFVDGRKMILHLEPEQISGGLAGAALLTRLVEKDVLHPNVIKALLDNVHLIPNSFKKNSARKTQYIFFWATGFEDVDGTLYVCCLNFSGGRWCGSFFLVDDYFDDRSPAVLLAS